MNPDAKASYSSNYPRYQYDGQGQGGSRGFQESKLPQFDSQGGYQPENKQVKRQAASLGPYRYGYAVQDDTGNDFNQQEQSDGNTVSNQKSINLGFINLFQLFQITGQYSVLLPDGRVQTVTYSVTPSSGYVVRTPPPPSHPPRESTETWY